MSIVSKSGQEHSTKFMATVNMEEKVSSADLSDKVAVMP